MPLSEQTRQRISSLIESHDVVLFMKGDRAMPQCGFSGKVVQILDGLLGEYETVDVLADAEMRDGLKEFSAWPTIPQLYMKGELVGGCDIVTDLYASGELHQMLGLPVPERKIPTVHITTAAAQRIREYLDRSPGKEISLTIDARFQASLGLAPRRGDEVEVVANGVAVLMDMCSAERAEGVSIDVVETPGGTGFKIDNPNAPGQIKQLSAAEVKKMIDDGVDFEFFDARTAEERAIAAIEGTRLLDEESAAYIETLAKDTLLVFHCHYGGRSQAAAERFRDRGFSNTRNLVGGIDAWSREADPSVPRY